MVWGKRVEGKGEGVMKKIDMVVGEIENVMGEEK